MIAAELQFADAVAAERAADSGARFASAGGIVYEWTGSHWSPVVDTDFEKKAWRWLSENVPVRAMPRVAASCAAAAALALPALPTRVVSDEEVAIPCRNGTVRLIKVDAGEWSVTLHPAERGDGLTYCLACDHTPGAAAPEFERFLARVQPDSEMQAYLQEYLGYTLLSDCRFQRAQWWIGPGADGKSTLASIVAALHERVAALQLDQLQGFALIGLAGASLVYCDETPTSIDEQKIKSLIVGAPMQIDRKFRDPVNLRATAKWIICGNNLPALKDQSAGFWRRFDVIPFSAAIPEHEQDPLVAERIGRHELAGVLNWCLAGLRRVLERGRLAQKPTAVVEAVDGGKRETNSVLAWYTSDEVELAAGVQTLKDEVYSSYADWCRRNGMQPVASLKFWRRLAAVEPGIVESQPAALNRRRAVNISIPPARLPH